MKVITETSLYNFDAGGEAINTKERIINEGKAEEFEQLIEELYPDGLTDIKLRERRGVEAMRVKEFVEKLTQQQITNNTVSYWSIYSNIININGNIYDLEKCNPLNALN